jgi:hypothetical protein
MPLYFNNQPKPASAYPTASNPQQSQLSYGAQAAPMQSPGGNNSGASNSDYAGILAKYSGSQSDPYYQKWKSDLDAGKLAGTDSWFFDKYKELAQGNDAISKQAAIEKQMAAAGYGQMQNQAQGSLAAGGMAKSGFGGEVMNDLAANENLTFSDIHNRMLDMQQQFRQGAQDRWQNERFMRKAENQQKKNRKMQILGTGLAAGATLLGGPIAGAGAQVALNQV